jgi:transposase
LNWKNFNLVCPTLPKRIPLAKKPTYEELFQTVQVLLKRIDELEQEVHLLRNKKNSGNSSIPPSKDENRPKRNQSLRKSSGKKPGGQHGHKGKTLEMTDSPDEIIKIEPDYCQCCGESLTTLPGRKSESRQIVDIPPIQALFTEYQVFKKKCPCGHVTVPDFPQGVTSPIAYGSNIEALTGYFHARQYLPFARMQEMFNDIFNINISEGGIHCLLNRFADKVSPVYELIRQRVEQGKVVGTDETGGKVNGKKHWFWTWQTPRHTYIAHSDNRGAVTINTHFPNGFPQSTLVHDAWRAQISTTAKSHQACLSHLQRELKYLNQLYPENKWGNKFLLLLYGSIEFERKMKPPDYEGKNTERDKIMGRFNHLLLNPPSQEHKELYTFYKRMVRDQQHIFTFLFIPEVPPDNNASERAVRNIKVKQKISGQFKIVSAAQNFAKIRSVIDTTIKNGLSVLDALALIAKFGPA